MAVTIVDTSIPEDPVKREDFLNKVVLQTCLSVIHDADSKPGDKLSSAKLIAWINGDLGKRKLGAPGKVLEAEVAARAKVSPAGVSETLREAAAGLKRSEPVEEEPELSEEEELARDLFDNDGFPVRASAPAGRTGASDPARTSAQTSGECPPRPASPWTRLTSD